MIPVEISHIQAYAPNTWHRTQHTKNQILLIDCLCAANCAHEKQTLLNGHICWTNSIFLAALKYQLNHCVLLLCKFRPTHVTRLGQIVTNVWNDDFNGPRRFERMAGLSAAQPFFWRSRSSGAERPTFAFALLRQCHRNFIILPAKFALKSLDSLISMSWKPGLRLYWTPSSSHWQ